MEENQKSRSIKVLVVEDNPDDIFIIRKIFTKIKKLDFDLVYVDRLQTAIEYLNQKKFDVVLLDLGLPDSHMLDTFNKLHTQTSEIPIVVMSILNDETIAINAIQQGAQDYMVKETINPDMVVRVISYAIERHKMLKELEQKNKELKKLDEMKSEFLSMVSHEFRTPLTIMKEFVSIMLDRIPGEINKDQKEYLTIIRDNINCLVVIINDLLSISKLESGKIKLEKSSASISYLIEGVINFFKPEAETQKIILDFSSTEQLPKIFIDKDRIIQVLNNLIGNAVKFTPEGGKITVNAKIVERLNGQMVKSTNHQLPINYLQVSVTDTGPGIAPENFERIFDRFEQIGKTGSKGTGLGLTIAKKIVEMHNGKIWVESPVKDGKGSKFIFMLPCP